MIRVVNHSSNVFSYRLESKAKPLKLPLSRDKLESFFISDFIAAK